MLKTKILVERGLAWEKAFEIYKQNVKLEHENAENHLSKNLPADGFYIYNQVNCRYIYIFSLRINLNMIKNLKNFKG
jgi:hypothetical protein